MKIISLEGPDFSGKTTIGTRLVMELRNQDNRVERMELPSRLVTGIFTELLRNSTDDVDPRVFALTYAADHLHHYLTMRDFNAADYVILERSLLSSYVYQGLLGNLDLDWLKEINKHTQTRPDLTAIVKTPIDELIRRKGIRVGLEDKFEKIDFLRRTARTYYDLPDWLIDEFNVEYFPFKSVDKTVSDILGELQKL